MGNPLSAILDQFRGIISKATEPERKEPGPGDVGPTVETKSPELVILKMSEEEVGAWWQRVERSRSRIRAREAKWDILLNEYRPIVSKSGEAETVKVQGHFRNVHSRIGQLFYRSPDLVLTPEDPGPAQNEMPNPMNATRPPDQQLPNLTMEDIVSIKQAVLTKMMGRDGIKSNRLMDELLFDVLAWAGIGCAKGGYRCVMKPIDKPVMGPDQNAMASPFMLGLGPEPQMPQVQTRMTQELVPIHEEWYLRRFSPKKALWNDDLRSTRFDEDATWMGMEFYMSPKTAMRVLKLTEEEASKAAEDDRVHMYEEDQQGGKVPGLVHGVEIFCKASIFTDELHPLAINQLILIEGIKDRPIVWRPSPDQEFDPMTGRLTDDSLVGFPIKILTIRDLADSPFPESDSAFTNSEIKQLSTWRRQSIQIRDAAIGKYFYDQDAFDEEEVEQLKHGEIGAYIGVIGGKLSQGADKIFTITAQIHATQDDYRGAQMIKRDIDETLGVSPNAAGVTEETIRSATETATVQAAISARNEKELSRVVDFYLDCVRMIDQLLMRYATDLQYIQITGINGARRMMMWNNQITSGKYLYDIAPDSQMRVDSARDFQLNLNMYNLAAQDPLFNRGYWLRRLARARGADPSKAVLDQSQLPKPEPEKAKVTVSAVDLLIPGMIPMLVSMGLIQAPTTPIPTQPVQPLHGGANQTGEAVSQHTASNSGGRPSEPGAENFRESQVK